ncbi:MAG TPA: hypothetical protein VK083_20775 [Nocardia sp.]|uniref:hypothetical protein n=1 Tax=Nocardia TaxID=1817 RepID=UPI002458FCB5|nr:MULTISPECIES: hypothetical protein [Nocardia]HLS79222.1 hypothetical protein [Nocardia sp.]
MRTAVHQGAAAARGALVGSAAGAVSLAAHPLGGGAVHLSQAAIVQLIGACAAVGVVAGSRRGRVGRGELLALLAAGQGIGHVALTVGHPHGPHLTPVMVCAHLAAMLLAAVLIRLSEAGLLAAASSVRRVLAALVEALRWPEAPVVLAGGEIRVGAGRLRSGGAGTRGPPARW